MFGCQPVVGNEGLGGGRERGKASGEFSSDTDAVLLTDAIFGPLYFWLLLRFAPLTEHYGDTLVDQVLRGARATAAAGR